MFSNDDDGSQGLVLAVVSALVLLVLALVIGLAIGQRDVGRAAASPALSGAAPALPSTAEIRRVTALAASDAADIRVESAIVKFYFASGQAELPAGALAALGDVIKAARMGRKVVISGFHDASGGTVKNAALASERAQAVRDALGQAGVPKVQIEIRKPERMQGVNNAETRRVEVTVQ